LEKDLRARNKNSEKLGIVKTKLIYSRTHIANIAIFINSLILAYVLWDYASHRAIVIWLASIMTATIFRTLLFRVYIKKERTGKNLRKWQNYLTISMLLLGTVWGSSAIFLFPETSTPHQVFIAFVLGGMVAGATGTNSTVIESFYAYSISSLLPVIVMLFLQSGEIPKAMGTMVTLFLVLMIMTARQMNRDITESLTLRFDNLDLIDNLVAEKDNAEKLNKALIQEIAERKDAETALRAAKDMAESANKTKDKFVSIVSHDLKGPLGTMIGFLELLSEDIEITERKKIVENAISSGQRMKKLIDDLLDIERLKTGKFTTAFRFLDPYYITENAIEHIKTLAQQKGISINNEIPKYSRIYADENLLTQATVNLLSNAVKFCNNGDKITLFIPQNEFSTIAIRDTGIGIHPDVMEQLFKEGIKFSTRGTRGEKGTGLGLLLCKDILDAHNGIIYAESEPDKGSTFYIKLPQVKPLVLTVDDSPDRLFLLSRYLKPFDVNIVEALNGIEALKLIESEKPHLVITDIKMPEMDGIELLTKIKKNPKTSYIPVIIVTSMQETETREIAVRMGVDDFITEPIIKNDLISRIQKFIG